MMGWKKAWIPLQAARRTLRASRCSCASLRQMSTTSGRTGRVLGTCFPITRDVCPTGHAHNTAPCVGHCPWWLPTALRVSTWRTWRSDAPDDMLHSCHLCGCRTPSRHQQHSQRGHHEGGQGTVSRSLLQPENPCGRDWLPPAGEELSEAQSAKMV